MRYRFQYIGADLRLTSPSARHQHTLQDHRYGLVYHTCACLLTQLLLGTHRTHPRRDGSD